MFLAIVPSILQPPKIWLDYISIILQVLRICALGMLMSLYAELRTRNEDSNTKDPERQSLLRRQFRPKSGYGSVDTNKKQDPEDSDSESDSDSHKKKKITFRQGKNGNWWTYARGFALFIPLIFPVHDRRLQARAFGVLLCLLCQRLLNVLIPIMFGIMAGSLIESSGSWPGPSVSVALYSAVTLLSSSSAIKYLQDRLYEPLERYSYESLSNAS